MRLISLALVTLVASAARGDEALPPPPPPLRRVALLEVARAHQPVGLVIAPGDARRRLFVVEKGGRLRVIERGQLQPGAILDLTAQVSRGSEQGLLGVAFHPRFSATHALYVNYTDRAGDTRIVAYRLDGDRVDPASARELLHVAQPYANHNGGDLVFGPDGKLWIGLGDGGAGYDPHGNGQNRRALLGKMLRLDVDAPAPTPEIVHVGLRNPWRYAFDRESNDLYIADVGQDRWEEIDVVRADAPPQNFGWNVLEGLHCLRGASCDARGMTAPVVEYSHKVGCSVTGGAVYRGRALPELDGLYFYGDYCAAMVRSFRWKDGRAVDAYEWRPILDPASKLSQLSAFGEDADGELYLLSLDGPIYKLVRRE